MRIEVFPTAVEMGRAGAEQAATAIGQAIAARGAANVIFATGASQFETLQHLTSLPVAWSKVTAFHLDEYIGLSADHPASFRRYLRERVAARAPDLLAFHYVDGENPDPEAECRRVGELISAAPIDVALIGIGENGHLAFNDPPADFETTRPYLVVDLDEACRRQQLGEGWFASLTEVPRQAISMGIRQIMKSRALICSVPDARKAQAVRDCLGGEVTPLHPASILQQHGDCTVYLDAPAAALLRDAGGLDEE